jgi:hypothetical protein
MTDEFEIKATGHLTSPERMWHRSTLDVAKFIADQAVERLGFTHAEVINTFGGHRSNPIYIVTPEGGVMQPEC